MLGRDADCSTWSWRSDASVGLADDGGRRRDDADVGDPVDATGQRARRVGRVIRQRPVGTALVEAELRRRAGGGEHAGRPAHADATRQPRFGHGGLDDVAGLEGDRQRHHRLGVHLGRVVGGVDQRQPAQVGAHPETLLALDGDLPVVLADMRMTSASPVSSTSPVTVADETSITLRSTAAART